MLEENTLEYQILQDHLKALSRPPKDLSALNGSFAILDYEDLDASKSVVVILTPKDLDASKGIVAILNKVQDSPDDLKRMYDILRTYNIAIEDIGEILRLGSKSDEAIACFEAAIKADANNHCALEGIATLYLDLGDFDKAKEYFEKVLEMKQDDEFATDCMKEIDEALENSDHLGDQEVRFLGSIAE
jgi:tetratricopeptide (TPR) repeat protein